MATSMQLSFADVEALEEPAPRTSSPEVDATRSVSRSADQAALAALEAALVDARASEDDRPPLVVLASCLGQLDGSSVSAPPAASCDGAALRQAREDWLKRLETAQKSESSLVAYRVAIDDLLDWSEPRRRSVLEEATIVDYLSDYQERAHPAPATYYRRFLVLRRFLRWVCRRIGAADPFRDLDPPPKPRQERDWLTREEFQRLLDAAGKPERNLPGLAERDQLVLRALVTTGLRRSELCALEWRDLELDGRKKSLLVRHGKGDKSRSQPIPARLARELRTLRDARQPTPTDPVFCGLNGGRLQETILADIIRRAATRAGIEKHVTAHTCATLPRPGCGKSAATPASSPSTSATPTSRPWLATRTSTARSSTTLPAALSSWPTYGKDRSRDPISTRRVTLSRISLPHPTTAPATSRPNRSGRAVAEGVGGGAAAGEK
jgi:integrase/recombinase XerC